MAKRGRPRKDASPKNSAAEAETATATAAAATTATTASSVSKGFKESERDQLGGDIAIYESSRRKDGVYMPLAKRDSIRDIRPGDYVFKPEPNKRFKYAWVPIGSTEWAHEDIAAAFEDGYDFCMATDFDVRRELANVVRPSPSGKLTFMGKEEATVALMWCPEERWRKRQKQRTRFSDTVDQYVEDSAKRIAGSGNEFAESARSEVSTNEEVRYL